MIKKLLILVVCVAVVAALVPSYVAASPSGGIDCFDGLYWWGFRVYLSDATCDEVAHQLIIGGGAVTITGILLVKFGPYSGIVGVIASIVGVIMGMTGEEINYQNRYNTGIKMRFNFAVIPILFPLPPLVLLVLTGIWPQSCGVYGLVRNSATGDPLPFSTVTVKQSGQVVQEVEIGSSGQYIIDLAPGTYLVTASHSGFYDLTIPTGVSDGAYTTLNFQLTKSTGGGGCPFLQVWDGSDYVDEGLLDIHNAEGVDVIYEHTLTTVPEPVNGAYEFRLIEHPKTISDMDQVQLRAILEDGTVKEFPLISAQHSEDGNVLNLLLKSDDRRVEEKGADHNGGTSQSIDLKFAALGPHMEPVAFIFTIEGCNMICKTCV